MRLFVAIDLPPALKEQIAALMAPFRERSELRWVRPESLHLNLVFLGEVPEAKVSGLRSTLDAVAGRHAPVRLRAAGAGTFGRPKAPRVLWLGVEGQLEQAAALQTELAVALGHVEDRAWSPHLTLARAKRGNGEPSMPAVAEALSRSAPRFEDFTAQQVTLFETRGGRYWPLHQATLAR